VHGMCVTSLSEFILALKCGDLSMRSAISSLSLSSESVSVGQMFLHNNFIEANKSDTLPTFCK